MSELKFLSEIEPRNVVGDWALRIGVGGIFIVFGFEKFSADPESHWIKLFHEIGTGDWFRYLTGVIEILGGLLVLIPQTAAVGLTMLALTMADAVLIVAFVLGRPADSAFPGVFLLGLIGLLVWDRRSRTERSLRHQ